MKARGIFAIIAAFVAAIGHGRKGASLAPANLISGRISNGRQAFYNVSGPRRANQSKNYAKGWAK